MSRNKLQKHNSIVTCSLSLIIHMFTNIWRNLLFSLKDYEIIVPVNWAKAKQGQFYPHAARLIHPSFQTDGFCIGLVTQIVYEKHHSSPHKWSHIYFYSDLWNTHCFRFTVVNRKITVLMVCKINKLWNKFNSADNSFIIQINLVQCCIEQHFIMFLLMKK